ncbi:MAG: hypothetical protein ACYC9O_10080 [Candidatus Latescibacterota bacterium]
MRNTIACVARDRDHAEKIVDRLKAERFPSSDISVVFSHSKDAKDFALDKDTKAPEGAVTGAISGGAIGGVLGWLAGIGTIAIPGVGPLIAAGPIAAALSGAAVGAGVGGIAGALIGMGFPEYLAKDSENRVKSGSVLITVRTDSTDEMMRARRIFEDEKAVEISAFDEEGYELRPREEIPSERRY